MLVALLAATAISGATAAQADTITVNSTTPTWTYVGGTSTNLFTSGTGNSEIWGVQWGQSTGSGQSGLGFNPAQPPSYTATSGTLFDLGTLYHYNNPITGNTPSSITLTLATSVQNAQPASQGFAFGFTVDETPNSPPCQYQTNPPGPACADKITFSNLDTTNAFTLGGKQYTMEIIGFSNDGGQTLTSSFISNEGGTNSAHLYAEFVAPHSAVPEPMSLALLGSGFAAVGMLKRKRKLA
jgi:hypothetical protein